MSRDKHVTNFKSHGMVQIQVIDVVDQDIFRRTNWNKDLVNIGLTIKKVMILVKFHSARLFYFYSLM